MSRPESVTIVEVGPRDGLQNEAAQLSVDDRVAFCNGLVASGLRVVEVGAFGNGSERANGGGTATARHPSGGPLT